jgi:hypothetical protein
VTKPHDSDSSGTLRGCNARSILFVHLVFCLTYFNLDDVLAVSSNFLLYSSTSLQIPAELKHSVLGKGFISLPKLHNPLLKFTNIFKTMRLYLCITVLALVHHVSPSTVPLVAIPYETPGRDLIRSEIFPRDVSTLEKRIDPIILGTFPLSMNLQNQELFKYKL